MSYCTSACGKECPIYGIGDPGYHQEAVRMVEKYGPQFDGTNLATIGSQIAGESWLLYGHCNRVLAAIVRLANGDCPPQETTL